MLTGTGQWSDPLKTGMHGFDNASNKYVTEAVFLIPKIPQHQRTEWDESKRSFGMLECACSNRIIS